MFSDLPIPSERDGYRNPDMEGFYWVTIRYKDGREIQIRRAVVNYTIVLDNGDIIKLNDNETIRMLRIFRSNSILVQDYQTVVVVIAEIEYNGYQYTPTESPYLIPADIPPYRREQLWTLKNEVSKLMIIDPECIHWGVRWFRGTYRCYGRIVDVKEPSDYNIQIDLFTTHLNYLHGNKLDRRQLWEIQSFLKS